MSEAIKPTKGEWRLKQKHGLNIVVNNVALMAESPYGPDNIDDWKLFVDAGNTYNTTGLTPSQLVERVKELEGALILMVRTHDEPADGLVQEAREQRWLEQARAALSKARPNTAEGE